MASIDLKDAFYSAPGIRHHQKYLVFFANEYLKFTCMPNGYGHAMKIFTKITKVPFSERFHKEKISDLSPGNSKKITS